MNECMALSDRMPAVASGRDAWSGPELDHLGSCADCAGEWRLVRATQGLIEGFDYAPVSAQLATRVLGRVDADVQTRRRARTRGWWVSGLAAAAVAVLAFQAGLGRPGRGPVATAVSSGMMVPELDSLSATELSQVLDGFDGPISEHAAPPQGMGDLSDQELERVLRAGGV